MLNKKILNNLVSKINVGYQEFCVWKYLNNFFAKYQDTFNQTKENGLCSSDKEAIKNSCIYKNFLIVTVISLQRSWILSLARLIDPPHFLTNKNKTNLSIYYILELLENIDLERKIKSLLNEQKLFTENITEQRNKALAHNDLNFTEKTIQAGVEDFFELLDRIIEMIKKEKNLKGCDICNFKYTDKLSEKGVNEIFEKLKNI